MMKLGMNFTPQKMPAFKGDDKSKAMKEMERDAATRERMSADAERSMERMNAESNSSSNSGRFEKDHNSSNVSKGIWG